jgi:predicted anti-sigma-YlaC factor YlaD
MRSCRDVARYVASDGLPGRGSLAALAVRVHLLTCRHCRRFRRELGALRRTARTLARLLPSDEARLPAFRLRLLQAAGLRTRPTP